MDEIYKKLEKELNVSEHIIETVLKHKYSWLRKQLTEMNHINILDNNFGTFYVPQGKIKKYLTYEEKLLTDKAKFNEILTTVTEYNANKKINK